jgi:hypothetical protein
VPPVIELHSDITNLTTSPKKRVSIAKYMPVTLTNGKAITAATAIDANPANGKAAQIGKLNFIMSMADVYAPIPAKAIVPIDI